jgi:hypothetical protein
LIGNVQPPEHIVRDKPDDKTASTRTKPEEDKTAESVSFRDIFLKKYTERK